MAITPLRLDGVTAHVLPTAQFKTGGCKFLRRRFILDQDVGLALAHGARAGATQRLEIEIALMPILPHDGEDAVYGFDFFRFHFAFVFSGHGQSLLSEQFGQLGLRAVHTRLPWNCNR